MSGTAGVGEAAGRTSGVSIDSVLIIACGALAREITAIIRVNRLDHVTLRCLPAVLHNRPDEIPNAVRRAIHRARGEFDRVLVAYADCGTGGRLDRVLAQEQVERLPGAHCYAFFTGIETFARRADADMRALFLTDFLARHAETFLIRPLGLDRHPELRDAYFGNYEKVVYLAQTDDPVLTEAARETARFLGLAFERRFTGFGVLEPFVSGAAFDESTPWIDHGATASPPVSETPFPDHRRHADSPMITA